MEDCNKVQRLGESRNSMYWILYQTINLVNNKIYIGVHKTKDPYTFDGYLGNGVYINSPKTYMYSKTAFEAAVKKYGVKSFRRSVLQIFTTETEAYKMEKLIVNKDFLARPDVYNMIPGGMFNYCQKKTTKIYQYSLSGKFLNEFNSFKEVAKKLNINSSSLSEACSCKISCSGYYWSKEKVDNLQLNKYAKLKLEIPIYAYDLKGNFIKEFPSTRSTGYSQASMSAILGNIVDNKYQFCYVKAKTYSEARDIYVKQRTIYQYDANGKYIATWNYLKALKTFPKDSINQAIRHKKLTKSGHYWGLSKHDIYNAPIKKANRKIAKYDLDNNLIKIYNNSSECYKENGKNVYKVLKGMRKSYKNHIYKYIE